MQTILSLSLSLALVSSSIERRQEALVRVMTDRLKSSMTGLWQTLNYGSVSTVTGWLEVAT